MNHSTPPGSTEGEKAIEFLREYAKCGINHNYTEPNSMLEKLDSSVKTLSGAVNNHEELVKACELALSSGAIKFADNALDRHIKATLEAALNKAK